MSSDYGDFCRAQRQRKQANAPRIVRENVQQLDGLLRNLKELRAEYRDHDMTVRLTLHGAAVDFWLSTGTAMVVVGREQGATRRGCSARSAVKWLKTQRPHSEGSA